MQGLTPPLNPAKAVAGPHPRAAPPLHCQEGLPQRREGRRGSLRPRQIDRASCEAFTLVGACIAPHRHYLSIAYLSGRWVTCHLQARVSVYREGETQ